MSFVLNQQLDHDTVPVGDLGACSLLLMNDRRFPWLILVPRRENVRELFDLTPTDYTAVMEEVRTVAQLFAIITGAHKINVAALGNVIPQLHIHVIARFENDGIWPKTIWNSPSPPEQYAPDALATLIAQIKKGLGL